MNLEQALARINELEAEKIKLVQQLRITEQYLRALELLAKSEV
jgi:hypothetical protein